MNLLVVGVLNGTDLNPSPALHGNSSSLMVKNWIGLVVKLGTLDGVCAPVPVILPL